MENEATYWIALAHLPNWGYNKINDTAIRFFHEEKISVEEFFNLSESIWRSKYQLTEKDILDLQNAKAQLPNNAFFAENLLSQGYELIAIVSPVYPKTLKHNLKAKHSPPLIYLKGNTQLLDEKSIAIVGSRAAHERSLAFADNIARIAGNGFKVVVSGFAKGVDKQALDSSIKYKGRSIIVLPQGITTFGSGFKTYYKQIAAGDVLVLSTFHPKADWSARLAMARNPVIYGLAEEIFVAESSKKGGTWSGVIDGLRKGRTIYVRLPDPNEQNANGLLIEKGAIPVDFNGAVDSSYTPPEAPVLNAKNPLDTMDERILNIFDGIPLSAKEILFKMKLDWPARKLKAYLQKMETIQSVKNGRTTQYIIKGRQKEQQITLFG